MEVDSLNTASTFVKCALDRSLSIPPPSHPIPSRLARTQLQPISRKREQNNSYRGANARAGTRAKGTRVTHQEGIAKRERGKEKNTGEKDKRERERERERKRERERTRSRWTFILRHPGPMSSFRFVPLPLPPPSSPPCRSDPGGTPGFSPVPRAGRRRDF